MSILLYYWFTLNKTPTSLYSIYLIITAFMDNIIICTYDEQLIPEMKTQGAAAWDMRTSVDFTIQPGEVKLISAGFKVFMPSWWQANFYARSWLPIKSGLMQANNVAIMDSDYRGEYYMQLYNFTSEPITMEKYSRLCQLQFHPVYQPEFPRYGTDSVPSLEVVVDQAMYDEFADRYPSGRWTGAFNSTWLK